MRYLKLLIIAAILLGSCDSMDFGDTNQDPIGPNEPSPKDLLAGGIMNFFNNSGRPYLTKPTFYVQWQAQNIYTSEMQYSDDPTSWNPWYVQVLSNFKTNIDYIDANRGNTVVKSMGDPDNQIGVNKVMMAYVFKFITDIYGDIPYSEALDPNNRQPKYDNQIEIYKDIIEQLKAARDMMDPTKPAVLGDIIYNGDVSKWQKLANSLIMHAALQLSDVDAAYASAEFNAALSHPAGVIETLDDEAWVNYSSQDRALQNPYSRLRAADYFLTKEFTDALQGDPKNSPASCNPTFNVTPDTRLKIYSTSGDRIYNSPKDPMVDDGKGYSCNLTTSGVSMSKRIWNSDSPLPFFLASWTFLDRAEAAARNWTSEDYNSLLTSAIQSSYETLSQRYGSIVLPTNSEGEPGVAIDITGDAVAYAAVRVADANDATYGNNHPNPKLLVVAEEKWVAYFPMGFEAWAQWRRLDMPVLTPHPQPLNATGQIPTRYTYPPDEITVNPNGYQSGVQDLTPAEDRNDSRIPWDVN